MKENIQDDTESFPQNPPWTMFFDGQLYQEYDKFMKNKDFSKMLSNTKERLGNNLHNPEVVNPAYISDDDHWNKEQEVDLTGNTYQYVSEDYYRRDKEDERRRTRRTRAFIILGLIIMATLAFSTALVVHYIFITPLEDRNPNKSVNVSISGNTTESIQTDVEKQEDEEQSLLDDLLKDSHHDNHGNARDNELTLHHDDTTTDHSPITTTESSNIVLETNKPYTSTMHIDPMVFFGMDEMKTTTQQMTTTLSEEEFFYYYDFETTIKPSVATDKSISKTNALLEESNMTTDMMLRNDTSSVSTPPDYNGSTEMIGDGVNNTDEKQVVSTAVTIQEDATIPNTTDTTLKTTRPMETSNMSTQESITSTFRPITTYAPTESTTARGREKPETTSEATPPLSNTTTEIYERTKMARTSSVPEYTVNMDLVTNPEISTVYPNSTIDVEKVTILHSETTTTFTETNPTLLRRDTIAQYANTILPETTIIPNVSSITQRTTFSETTSEFPRTDTAVTETSRTSSEMETTLSATNEPAPETSTNQDTTKATTIWPHLRISVSDIPRKKPITNKLFSEVTTTSIRGTATSREPSETPSITFETTAALQDNETNLSETTQPFQKLDTTLSVATQSQTLPDNEATVSETTMTVPKINTTSFETIEPLSETETMFSNTTKPFQDIETTTLFETTQHLSKLEATLSEMVLPLAAAYTKHSLPEIETTFSETTQSLLHNKTNVSATIQIVSEFITIMSETTTESPTKIETILNKPTQALHNMFQTSMKMTSDSFGAPTMTSNNPLTITTKSETLPKIVTQSTTLETTRPDFLETTTLLPETTTTLSETTTTTPEVTTLPENYNTVEMSDETAYTFNKAKVSCNVKHAVKWQSLSVKVNQTWRPLEVTLVPSGAIKWSRAKKDRHDVIYDITNSTDGTGSNMTLSLVINDVQCRDANTFICSLKSVIEDRTVNSHLIVVGKPSEKISLTLGPSIIEDRAFRITASWQGGYPIPWANMSWTALDANNKSYNLADYGEYRDYELHEDHKFCQTTLKSSIVVFPRVHLNDTTVIVRPNIETKRYFVDSTMEKYLRQVQPGQDKILVIPLSYCKNGRTEMSIPHPYTSCTKFVRCLIGDMVIQQCPRGTCFYEGKQECG